MDVPAAEQQRRKQPLLNNQLKVFMVAMVLANIAGRMSGSLLPNYLMELDATEAQVGLFFTLSRILPLVLQILGGWFSDSLGRLRSIAIGSVAGVLGYLGLLLAPSWLALISLIANVAAYECKIRIEEAYLREAHGAAYAAYCRRTGRYLPRLLRR